MSITQTGVGYTGSGYTFTGVALTSITGTGINIGKNITINNGGSNLSLPSTPVVLVIKSVIFWNQSLLVMMDLGVGIKLSVSSLSGNNEMVLTGVQGQFTTNTSDVLRFESSVGSTSNINGGGVYIDPNQSYQ